MNNFTYCHGRVGVVNKDVQLAIILSVYPLKQSFNVFIFRVITLHRNATATTFLNLSNYAVFPKIRKSWI